MRYSKRRFLVNSIVEIFLKRLPLVLSGRKCWVVSIDDTMSPQKGMAALTTVPVLSQRHQVMLACTLAMGRV